MSGDGTDTDLVTGAFSYSGSRIAELLIESGREVRTLTHHPNRDHPLRARERLTGGLWRRRFSGGVVYTVEPGATAKTITLPTTMRSAEWGEVQSLTLDAKEGAVLVG